MTCGEHRFARLSNIVKRPSDGSSRAYGIRNTPSTRYSRVSKYFISDVAVWIARADHSVAANLAVWYQQEDGPEGKGETWLKDMRQWWRRSGRNLEMPVDGVSGPTRSPGQHLVTFDDEGLLKDLPAGDYVLHVEAAREVGGRELVKIPFAWGSDAPSTQTLSGETELGTVSLTLKP